MNAIADFEQRLSSSLLAVFRGLKSPTAVQAYMNRRAHTRPLEPRRFQDPGWMWDKAGIQQIFQRLYQLKPMLLISETSASQLNLLYEHTFQAGTTGTDFNQSFGAH